MDSVSIDGIGGGLPQWATELTAKGILSELKKLNRGSENLEKAIKNFSDSGTSTSAIDDLEDALSDLERSTDNQTESALKSSDAMDDLSDSAKKASGTLGSFIGGTFMNIAKSTVSTFTMANVSLLELNRSGLNLTSVVDNVASGIGTLSFSLKEGNLTFEEITALQKEYGSVLAQYGIQSLTKTSRYMTEHLRNLGVTSAEAASWLSDYLETQQTMGIQMNIESMRQRERLELVFSQFDEWSKVLGRSREDMLASLKESAENLNVKLLNAQLGEAGKRGQEILSAVFGDMEGFSQIMEAAVAPVAEYTELYQGLLKVGATEAAREIQRINQAYRSGTLTMEDAQQMLSVLASQLKQTNDGYSQHINTISQYRYLYDKENTANILFAAQTREAQLRNFEERSKIESEANKTTEAQLAASAKGKDAVKELTNAIERSLASIYENAETSKKLSAAIDTSATNITDAVRDLTPSFTALATNMTNLVLEAFSAENINKLGESVKNAIQIFEKFVNGISSLGGVGAGIATAGAVAGGAGLYYAGSKAIKGTIGSLGGRAGAAGATGGALSVGGITSMLGKIISRAPVIAGVFGAATEAFTDIVDSVDNNASIAETSLVALESSAHGFFNGLAGMFDFITFGIFDLKEGFGELTGNLSGVTDSIGSWIGETVFNLTDDTNEYIMAQSQVEKILSEIPKGGNRLGKVQEHIKYLKNKENMPWYKGGGLDDYEEQLLKVWEEREKAMLSIKRRKNIPTGEIKQIKDTVEKETEQLNKPTNISPDIPKKIENEDAISSKIIVDKMDELIGLLHNSLKYQTVMARNLKDIKLNTKDLI